MYFVTNINWALRVALPNKNMQHFHVSTAHTPRIEPDGGYAVYSHTKMNVSLKEPARSFS